MRTFQRHFRHNTSLDQIDKYVRLVLKTFDIMTTTGKHLFVLLVLKEELTEERINKFYEMGSLLQKNTNGMGVMKSILMDNKIKFNF